MKLSFTTLGCPDWDLGQMIDGALSSGFDGIDLRGSSGEMELWRVAEFSDEARLAQTAARLRAAGLEVPCVSSSGRLLVDSEEQRIESLDNLRRFAEIGGALGANFVRVFGGFAGERPHADAVREAAAMLDTMAVAAAEFGVTVLVETHDDWEATDKLREVLDAGECSNGWLGLADCCRDSDCRPLLRTATAPNIGAVWDINHPYRRHQEAPETSWRNLAPHIKYVHVKDSYMNEEDEQEHAMIGDGEHGR